MLPQHLYHMQQATWYHSRTLYQIAAGLLPCIPTLHPGPLACTLFTACRQRMANIPEAPAKSPVGEDKKQVGGGQGWVRATP